VNIPNETFLRLEIEAIRELKRKLPESLDHMEEAKKWSTRIAHQMELRVNDKLELKLRGQSDKAKSETPIQIVLSDIIYNHCALEELISFLFSPYKAKLIG